MRVFSRDDQFGTQSDSSIPRWRPSGKYLPVPFVVQYNYNLFIHWDNIDGVISATSNTSLGKSVKIGTSEKRTTGFNALIEIDWFDMSTVIKCCSVVRWQVVWKHKSFCTLKIQQVHNWHWRYTYRQFYVKKYMQNSYFHHKRFKKEGREFNEADV